MSLGIPPPDLLRERVRAAVSETRPTMGWPARLSIAVVTVAASIAIALMRMRPDMHAPSGALIALTAVLAVLAIATSAIGLTTGSRGLGAPLTTLAIAAIATAPIYASLTMMWPQPLVGQGASPVNCFVMATAIGAVVLTGLTFALRHAVPAAPLARGALVGACAGAWAGLAIHMHCPATDKMHILVGHALPLLVATLLGVLIVPRFLKP
ncbi:MAG: NrsF family protein [Polyangiales bacterium]